MRIAIQILFLALLVNEVMVAQNGHHTVDVDYQAPGQHSWEAFVSSNSLVNIEEPPPHPVRMMAEWEELQALAISWRDYPSILTEIVRHASLEVKVVIFCDNAAIQQNAQTSLTNAGISLDNVAFVIAPNNSAWIRDFGPVSVYANDVEDLYFVDWVYNRQEREDDETIPNPAGAYFNVPVYASTVNPNRLVNIGGNCLTDGLGTAFASKLVLKENGPDNPFGAGPHSESEIDQIMEAFNGIGRYIKLDTLQYDAIHHLDMHMKLLDERTLLVGEYPSGLADWSQIETNLQYLLNNYESTSGGSYKVKRIIQPPDFGYIYPPAGDYRTYTNSVFVNKTILVPSYQETFDTTALRIYRREFPGYKIVLINCNQMIEDFGALHCITKEIGVKDPLWIVHPCTDDILNNDQLLAGYAIKATIKHRTGIVGAKVHYRIDTMEDYQVIDMQPTNSPDEWLATIPHQPNGSRVYYYVSALANSGKEQVRPLAAPAGYCHFWVDQSSGAAMTEQKINLEIFPNPASGSTYVNLKGIVSTHVKIDITDILGRQVKEVFHGTLTGAEFNQRVDLTGLGPGAYFLRLASPSFVITEQLLVF